MGSRHFCLQKVDALERQLAQKLTLSKSFRLIDLCAEMRARASTPLCSTTPLLLSRYFPVVALCTKPVKALS